MLTVVKIDGEKSGPPESSVLLPGELAGEGRRNHNTSGGLKSASQSRPTRVPFAS